MGYGLCLQGTPSHGGGAGGTKVKPPLAAGTLNHSPNLHLFFPTCNLIPAGYKSDSTGAREIKINKM